MIISRQWKTTVPELSYYSLFEEQNQKGSRKNRTNSIAINKYFAESSSFFPELEDYAVGTSQYLDIIRRAEEN
ncbi:MAG: hypothetical protein IPO26_07625 [Saprospiraceae bacterium]|nr:hypothetical protein [Saprospiraceae bacterium]